MQNDPMTPGALASPEQAPAIPSATPEQRISIRTQAEGPVIHAAQMPTVEPEHASVWDTAKLVFMHESPTAQLAMAHGVAEAFESDKVFDPNFNRYEYFLANKDQYNDIAQFVANGALDSARSPEAFRYKAQLIREQVSMAGEIEKGSLGGQLLGMGLSMFDVTSLLSFGALARVGKGASMLTRMRYGAAVGAADAMTTEGILQNMDSTRDARDAFMSLGAGTFLGAGLGAAFKGYHPTGANAKHIEPGNPANALHPDNLDAPGNLDVTHAHKVGQLPEEGVTMHGDTEAGSGMSGSIGAAAVKDSADIQWAGAGSNSIAAMPERLFSKLFEHWTPIARMQHYTSEAREYLGNLVDLGGRMTRGMSKGRALTPDAETLHEVYKQQGRSVLRGLDDDYRALQMALGQSKLGTAAKDQAGRMFGGANFADRNAVKRDVFNATVEQIQSRKSRDNVRTEIEVKELLQARGMDEATANAVYAHANKSVERMADLYETLGKEAVARGLVPADKMKGRGYMPQVYMRAAIREDRAGFRAMLQKHLSAAPADDWLEERLVGLVKHNPDGTSTPLYPNLEAFKKDERALAEAHSEWIGEHERLEKDRIDAEFESAMSKADKASDLYNEIAQGTDLLAKDVKLRTVKERAVHTRRVEADLHGRRIGYALARAEKAQAKVDDLERRAGGDVYGLAADAQRTVSDTGNLIDDAFARGSAARAQASEAQGLVDALRTEKAPRLDERAAGKDGDWGAKRDAANADEAIQKINAELREARAARDAAQADVDAAKTQMNDAARQQRNAQQWLDATAKEIDKHAKDFETAANKAGAKNLLDGLEDRLDQLKQAEHNAAQNVRFAKDLLKQSKVGQAMSKAELKAAMKAGKMARRASIKAEKATPLNEYIDDLTNALSGDDRYPGGLLLDPDAQAARLKERRFDWSQEHWDELASKGFVETNAAQLSEKYVKTVGAHLSLNKALDGKSRADVLKAARTSFEDKINLLSDPKERLRQTQLGDAAIKDIDAQFDRILGKYELADDTLVSYAGGKLRQMGHLRYGGGFIFNLAGDFATAMASAPGFLRHSLEARKVFRDLVKEASNGGKNHEALQVLLESMETGAHIASTFSTHGAGTRDIMGYGTGLTRQVTTKADKLMNLLGERVNTLSGLGAWSTGVRRTAGIVQMGNIAKWTAKGWDNLSPGQQADLAVIGIGKRESERIAALYAKHGTKEGALVNPGITKWYGEPGGAEMVDVFNAALIKTQKRASYTSGYGNMPLLMDKTHGKMFLQFQSFGLQMSNNFFQAGLQRAHVVGGVEGFTRLASTFGMAIAGAWFTAAIRAEMRGEDVTEWSTDKWARETMSRSGLLGITQSYVDAGAKLVGPEINEFLGANLFDNKSSKYSQNKWYESLMGPWLGNLGLVGQATGNAATGDTEAAWKKARQLIPLNQQLKLFGLMDQK